MDQHTLELLGFPRVLESLRDACLSEEGRRRLEQESIALEEGEVAQRLALACALHRVLESGRQFPALDFPDLGPLLPKLFKIGAQLDLEELHALGRFAVSGSRLRRHVASCGEPLLRPLAEAIPELRELVRGIFSIVDRDGQLREAQIPELKEIRERMRSLQRDTERIAQGYLANPAYRSYWHAEVPGQKNGRTVLPVKSNFKGRIPGIVHDVSSSGATLYLEPMELVEKNNAITELQNRYRREVHRILREASARVIADSGRVRALVDGVAALDSLYARAVFAARHRCRPALPAKGRFALNEARHPLLGSSCVPVTLAAGDGYRVLIITGPNTGGKTVTLKTVGLLAVLNQFGMEIPAREDSCLCVFDTVLADIGDEQSIEQSLSTFSGHIRNIARLIRDSSPRSLVLFDELGAGTDPEEGVAIAMSLLDYFIQKGCLCLATTHHGSLKSYGYSREGVENAAMDFDSETLEATYRVIMGVPGQSHALEVARRCGISEEMLERAREYLRDERGEAAELIDRLAEKSRELAVEEQRQDSRESELREQRRETDLKELRLRQRELELRDHGVGELRRLLRDSRREFEQLMAHGAAGTPERQAAQALFGRLEAAIGEQEQAVEQGREALSEAKELRAGMEVQIRGTSRRGKILRPAKAGRWVVATETLRGTFDPADLAPVSGLPEAQEPALSFREEIHSAPAVFQLDVRGLRLEEALRQVEQQIDKALLGGLTEFSIVHGMGEGVLRRGIHEFLKRCAPVKEYFFSTPEQGGFGRTVVRLG